MRKWTRALVVCLLAVWLLLGASALAVDMNAILDTYTLDPDTRARVMEALVAQGDISDEDAARAMIEELISAELYGVDRMAGTLEGDMYTHPAGFRVMMPFGWSILEREDGTGVLFVGEMDDLGVMPELAIACIPEAEGALCSAEELMEAMFQDDFSVDAQTVSFEEMPFLDTVAYEWVADAQIQTNETTTVPLRRHVLQFVHAGMLYTIEMTDYADEAAQTAALERYDQFLATLVLR